MKRFALVVLGAVAALTVPFLLLVGTAVWLHGAGWPTWPAVLVGVAVAAAAVSVAAWGILPRLSRRPRWRTVFVWVAFPATLGFAGQGLLTLGAGHAKTPAERADWRRTHPLLRLSVATLVLADRHLVITDLTRSLGDYEAWGLPPLEASPHLSQSDGYAHAMDLRTTGRGRVHNWLLERYFRMMGFRTLRHVGTADHLHVGLPPAGS